MFTTELKMNELFGGSQFFFFLFVELFKMNQQKPNKKFNNNIFSFGIIIKQDRNGPVSRLL